MNGQEIFLAVATHGTFSRGSHLCQTCVRDVEKLINLRQNIQKEEDILRKLFRRAGEAKIICRQMKRLFRLGMAEAPELVLASA